MSTPPRFMTLVVSAALAGCLADIPELTVSSGTGGSSGATTSAGPASAGSGAGSTTIGSTATGFCDGEDASVEFCADFDGAGGVGQGWTEVFVTSPSGTHIELASDEFISPSGSARIWVDDAAPGCSYAQMRKSFREDISDPALRIEFQALAKVQGVVSEIDWQRGATECAVLVYLFSDSLWLSFRAQPAGLQVGFRYTLTESPIGQWRDIEILMDRAAQTYDVWNGPALLDPMAVDDNAPWFAACTDPAPDGDLDFKLGSYCVPANSDLATDAHFDDVTFNFLP